MAIDSANKRKSSARWIRASRTAPIADGSLDSADRRHRTAYRGPLIAVWVLYGTSVALPALQVLIGDSAGRVLGEIRPLVERYSWEMGGVGSCAMTVAASTDESLLRPGNRVLIRSDSGIANWGGVLTGAMEWDGKGRIAVAAAGLIYALKWQLTSEQRVFAEQTLDVIITDLIGGIFAAGTIASGSSLISVEYNYVERLGAIEKLLGVEDWVMEVEADVAAGAIGGTVNVFARGSRTAQGALVEGHNAGEISYRREDGIVNVIHVVGAGDGWGEDRVMTTRTSTESVALYGAREAAYFLDGVSSLNALETWGDNLLARMIRPREAVQMETADREPAGFGEYIAGDVIRVILPGFGSAGVNGLFEIMGLEYFPGRNVCGLVLEGQ